MQASDLSMELPSAAATPTEKLRFALQFAVFAPSGHNAQPWKFKVSDDGVEIWADRSRALPVIDHDDRELTISCGAALLNLRSALEHLGVGHRVETIGESDLLARVVLQDELTNTAAGLLFRAITMRHTHRAHFLDQPLAPELVHALEVACALEGTHLTRLEGDARRRIIELVSLADRKLSTDPKYREELRLWLGRHEQRESVLEGVELTLLDDFASGVSPLLNRLFDWGQATALKDADLAARSPLLVSLGTAGDEPEDWVACGQAMERLLLTAALHGVQASWLNQPLEIPESRIEVRKLSDGLHPHLLLRLGHQARTPRSPGRRPLEEVIVS